MAAEPDTEIDELNEDTLPSSTANDAYTESEQMVPENLSSPKSKSNNQRQKNILSGRGVNLSMLLNDGILETGEGLLSIDYLGTKFVGDLLPKGRIKCRQTKKMFASPSSWAIYCKKLLNPDKRSGCGWSSIRYKGKKLDSYKSLWFKKLKQKQQQQDVEVVSPTLISTDTTFTPPSKNLLFSLNSSSTEINPSLFKEATKKSFLNIETLISKGGNEVETKPNISIKSYAHCPTFNTLEKKQPFTVSIASNCLLLVDFHCHLTKSEVVGYLGGTWDSTTNSLTILQAFPCRIKLDDKENSSLVEQEIRRAMEHRHLNAVGWYHSHPFHAACPTWTDIDKHLQYQSVMKADPTIPMPCIGLICSPYPLNKPQLESEYVAYWVLTEGGEQPVQLNYSMAHDSFLTQDLLTEMRLLSDYYRGVGDGVQFIGTTNWEKLKHSLRSKLPRDLQPLGTLPAASAQAQAVTHFWDFLKGLILT